MVDEAEVEDGKEQEKNRPKKEDLIIEAKSFFDFHKKELGESIRKGQNVIFLDFMSLTEFSNKLAEEILSNPEEALRMIELAIEESGLVSNVRVRLNNLPKGQEVKVRNIRSKNLNEMLVIEGIIRQASDVRPQVVNAKFECPSCGTIISVLQIEKKFHEPSRCSCGRKGGFRLISKEMVDTQRIVVEESPESLSGGEQPKRMNVFVKEDLVEPKMEEKTTPGSRVKVIGILKEVPVPLASGGLSTRFEFAIEANNIIPMEETFEELNISDEDEKQILELSEDPKIFDKLARSIIPSVWGYEEIKKALVLQLFGGVKKIHADGQKGRGDIHILLIGDPGVAKSVTLNFMANISPKGRYVVGKSASGAGLTATVIRDEYLRGWSLEAGAMVLANKGLVCIDELEKMDPNDRSSMHEAMEQQCMLPNFKLMLSDGKEVEIGSFVDDLIEKNKGSIYDGKDCQILPVDNVELLSTDFQNHFPLKATRISRHIAPREFVRIELSNGREITVTPEHPCWIVENGKIKTIAAEKLSEGMFFPVPSKIDIKESEYKKENDLLCKILGYHITDGSYELNRGKKNGIQFWNNDRLLIEDYKNATESYFGIKSGLTKRGKQHAVRIVSKSVVEKMEKIDKNLMEKGDKKIIPEAVIQLPKENIKYLLRALFDGDGTVVFQSRGGCRATLVTENKKLAEQVSDLLLRFEIQSSIFKDKNVWRLDISGQENLGKFLINISFLSQKKKNRLKEYCEKDKTYRTIRDVIPNCTDKINEIFKKIGINAKEEIGHQIDLGVEKQRLFLQKLVLIAEKHLNNRREYEVLRKDIDEIKRLAFGYARWVKIIKVSKINNKGIKWVYDVTIEPHHTFISNGMILHNTITISKANVQACYSEDTEILTEEGWKKYNEVKNLKIAQYNPDDKSMEFLSHKGLYTYNYNGKMYNFINKRNNIFVTPNHTMLIKPEKQKSYRKINAENITSHRFKVINSGNFIGDETDLFILPGIRHKQKRTNAKYVHQHHDKRIPMELWLEFLGYYVTEGGVETRPTIGIVQKKGPKADKIKNCLKKLTDLLGCSLSEIDAKEYLRFKITQTQLYESLKSKGEKVYFKRLGINFASLSKKQLVILYNALMLGDGSSDGKYFSCTSKELNDEVQVIAHLIGKSASQSIHYREGSRGRRKTAYRVTFSDRSELEMKKNSVKKIDYNGKVWCFSTQTGFFVTRRNGKIAIQGNTLRAETSVLAAANPKFGRFDPYQSIAQQIDLPPTLINRFDIIFTLRDIPDKDKDAKIATHVLSEHRKEGESMLIPREIFRKYVAYSKQRIKPELSEEAVNEIKNFYVDLRNRPVASESAMRPIPISARQLQALIRMSEASAKIKLREVVTREDAKISIDLMKYYLMEVGYDYESKSFDIDKATAGTTSSQRSKIFTVRDTMIDMESRLGKMIPVEELENELEGKLSKDEIEEAINKLASQGEIFRPRRGFVSRTS
ncbi:MAG: LAGLIDADG family homing endonuclease [Nanoarchaeota archaeon]